MNDTTRNPHMVKAYELVDFICSAIDLEELILRFGRAYGFPEALTDSKLVSQKAFANMSQQARDRFEKTRSELGLEARQPVILAPKW